MRRFYRLTALLLAFLLAGALCGCAQLGLYGGESERDPETRMLTGEKNGLWVAYFGQGMSGEDLTARRYVVSTAQQLEKNGGIERYMLFCCNGDEATQLRQMERAAKAGYDAFLIDPCGRDALKYAKELADGGNIVFAAEISDEYSISGVLSISCSTESSDRAATDYVCSAAEAKKRVYVITVTSDGLFGAKKHGAFAGTLEDYPDFIAVADLQYRAGGNPAPAFEKAFVELARLEPEMSAGECELIILCDRIDGELLDFILERSPITPLLAVSDRIDFLDRMSAAAQNGVRPRFAIVNSPADLPAIAMNILARAASGDEFRPNAVQNGQITIDITFTMTDAAFQSDVITLGIADNEYVATGIMQDVVSGLFY